MGFKSWSPSLQKLARGAQYVQGKTKPQSTAFWSSGIQLCGLLQPHLSPNSVIQVSSEALTADAQTPGAWGVSEIRAHSPSPLSSATSRTSVTPGTSLCWHSERAPCGLATYHLGVWSGDHMFLLYPPLLHGYFSNSNWQ